MQWHQCFSTFYSIGKKKVISKLYVTSACSLISLSGLFSKKRFSLLLHFNTDLTSASVDGDFLLIANRKRFWFEDTSTVAAFLIVSKPIHFHVHLRTDWSQTTALICAPRTKIDFYIAVSVQHSSGAFTLTIFSFLLISKLSFVTIVQIYRLLKAMKQRTESLCLFCLVWLNVL